MLVSLTVDSDLTRLISDDPVRPEIPVSQRIDNNGEVLVALTDSQDPAAVVCVRYCDTVPETVDQLLDNAGGRVAVFYTIWSYKAGAGAKLIFQARDHIQSTRPGIDRFVTLSPQTDMARKFHLRHGAFELRANTTTINYEYP